MLTFVLVIHNRGTMDLKYTLHSGKNSNLKFYIVSYAMHLVPRWLYVFMAPMVARVLRHGQDMEYVGRRVAYYNQLQSGCNLPTDTECLCRMRRKGQSAYFHDLFRTSRWFEGHLKCVLLPGDITYVPEVPSIVKSRPVEGNNANSVIMKLNRTRHFIFLHDKLRFEDKADRVVFRGGVFQPHRRKFMQMYFGHPLVDAAESNKHASSNPPEWRKPRITIYDHLKYKFIMTIKGNDVASNLKWVMSSNSIAVMPRPTFETWFMEGTLKPNYHYIEIKPDFSDLEERIRHYLNHPDEAKAIIAHAHEYVAQFQDSRRETLIEWMVLAKYFRLTGQSSTLKLLNP